MVAPHPSARWAWFEDAPIHTIWRRNRAAGDYDDRPIDWRGEGALIVRPHDAVVDFAIDGAACALLDALAAGAGREAALARVDDAGHDAASAFAFLVDAQALTIPAGAACAIR